MELLQISVLLSLCAVALALPVALADGTPFPYRDAMIFFTFVVIAVTLVIRIWRESQISDEVLREFEEELDYKESHL